MSTDLSERFVIGISSRALFDLSEENKIFEEEGLEAYCKYQLEHEDEVLDAGAGLPLVRAFLRINEVTDGNRQTEVVIMSRNNADTSLRIFRSIDDHELDITRAALTSGASLAPYLRAFSVDLFLSAHDNDVERAIGSGVPAGLIYSEGPRLADRSIDQIRIAFDGDAVLFSGDSELIYQNEGEDAFYEHEVAEAQSPLQPGPLKKLLKELSALQQETEDDEPLVRTALVTARNRPAHERVIHTLRDWGVRVDEAFFMGGVRKDEVLRAFEPHIFFDDKHDNVVQASEHVPAAQVPFQASDSSPRLNAH